MEIHSTSVGRDAKDRLERTASRKPRSELFVWIGDKDLLVDKLQLRVHIYSL